MRNNIKGLISIIIPVYNVEPYLKKCAESVLSQTYKNLEIIFIDDGATDSSGKICDGYAFSDNRVIVIHQKNAGMSVARNKGLAIAKGEYIGFVDSDDYIEPDMFQVLYEKAVETGSDIVECNFHHTYQNKEDTEVVEKYYDKKWLICLGRGVPWNKLYRHELIQKTEVNFPPELYYEDMEFYIKLVPFAEKYSYVNIAPYHYVQYKKSINNYPAERTKHVFQILDNIILYFKQKGIYNDYKEMLEFYCARILLCSSFARMCNIADAVTRNKTLRENWVKLIEKYPEWRKNAILKEQKSKQAMFMRSINTITYNIYSKIFPVIYAVGRKVWQKKYY